MTEYVECLLNGRFPLIVPDFRKTFWDERPHWHQGLLESCFELMQPGMTVYDIGAEHGDLSAVYRKFVGPDGDVISVEPAAWYWPFIRGTFEANSFPPPEMSFVGLIGDKDVGDRPFESGWPPESEGEGIPDGGFIHLRHAAKKYTQTTIDQLAVWTNVDAIVLDIEGAEWNALNGARGALERCRPIVFVSVHDVGDGAGWNGPLLDWYGKTPDDIHNFMSEYGYSHELLPSHGEGESFHYYSPQ